MHIRTTRRLAGAAVLGMALLFGAAPGASAQDAGGKPIRVVTTFTILQDMAQNVAGEAAIVESITRPGAEIHDYEPTPLDVVKAQAADLVLWNGMGLERWFERFFQRVKDVPSAVLTEGITPVNITEGPYSGRPNPHSWMSPANAVIYVENIRKALVAADPRNEAVYNANAARYAEQIKALDAPIREQLSRIPAERRWLVSCEGAFSYLTQNYGMKELYLWPINAEEEGTPQQIRKVVDTVRKNRIPALFCESTVSDRAMRQVAREGNSRFAGELYADSLTDEGGDAPTYVKLLEYNANAIVRAFQAKPVQGQAQGQAGR
ncbi:metal ABC transporter substrate-binding protein [Pseudoroseomonas rhizosphaerae]|uniref:Metal ABC transporter substrate-binding protein n=1 Tax=Teichococcus rhizosphaerae TaxID=1335062 RepID=A0A2C7A7J0_9PROT|nr:metal ABC transporter substrate-binding protein [Pseudoroseomonas rhizosphaerae]PHK93006.1 metal ABC transporter substrate-binding protein [Pseudoroseomonas rhizosphaerae]